MRLPISACTALLVLASAPAIAGAGNLGWEGIGGWEGDSYAQGYGFIAAGALIPAAPHLTVPVRVSVSYLYYRYDSSGTSVNVQSPGISVLSGLRTGPHRATFDLLAGPEVRQDRRTPNAPGSSTSSQLTPGVEAMLDADVDWVDRWNSYLLLDYESAARYWYGSANLRFQLSNTEWSGPIAWFTGAEAVREGNDESDSYQGGGFVETTFVKRDLSIGLHAGYQDSGSPGEARSTGPYFGVSLYRHF